MTEARRKFWGWGLESETLSETDAGRIARRVGSLTAPHARSLHGTARHRRAGPAGAAGHTAGCAGRALPQRCLLPREPYLRQVVPGLRPRVETGFRRGAGCRRLPRGRGGRRRAARLGGRCGARGHSLWRGVDRGGGRRAQRRGQFRGRPHHRLGPPGQGVGDRPGLPRGTHSGRRARAGARSPAQAGGAHAPALPAILRLLDPRRLDRHPLRRPLRHALHPHRRVRGEPAHGDAGRHAGKPPPAGLRRRPEP